MALTFQEKSLWLTLAGLVAAFAGYVYSAYSTVLPVTAARDVVPQQAGLFIAATVLLVLVLVVGHTAIALFERRTEPDERDRSIELRAGRHGGCVLAAGVFVALCTALTTQGNAVMAHVLLGFWVLAQGVETVSQLVLYRLGH